MVFGQPHATPQPHHIWSDFEWSNQGYTEVCKDSFEALHLTWPALLSGLSVIWVLAVNANLSHQSG
jgi:hypothetical protein